LGGRAKPAHPTTKNPFPARGEDIGIPPGDCRILSVNQVLGMTLLGRIYPVFT